MRRSSSPSVSANTYTVGSAGAGGGGCGSSGSTGVRTTVWIQ